MNTINERIIEIDEEIDNLQTDINDINNGDLSVGDIINGGTSSLMDEYDEMFEGAMVDILGSTYDACWVLRKIDPVAYGVGLSEFGTEKVAGIESQIEDLQQEKGVIIMMNTTTRTNEHGVTVTVFCQTEIVKVFPAGEVKLNSGGHRTATIKRRMNQVQSKVRIYQKDGEWWVEHLLFDNKKDELFFDGMRV